MLMEPHLCAFTSDPSLKMKHDKDGCSCWFDLYSSIINVMYVAHS